MYHKIECLEADRYTITKYRTGSHLLMIQMGRSQNTPRNDRLCQCGNEIQTIDHVLFKCALTEVIKQNTDIKTFFENKNYEQIAAILVTMEKLLNVKH